MRLSLASLCATVLFVAIPFRGVTAQGQQTTPTSPTIKVTSALVFLDVTVLDKKGHPVVSGLTQDDFTITEDKVPQRIFSFEAPEAHVIGTGDENPNGNAPKTILVMDLLNSNFEDFAYIRYEVERFLDSQPSRLPSPTELLVVDNDSLEMRQSFTRSRADLLDAVKHAPVALPYKHMHPRSFAWEMFGQSLDALDQIALQSKGVPGRKNIVWVGHGAPNVYLDTAAFGEKSVEKLKQYVHSTTNMMVDARISLFVIYPGLPVRGGVMTFSATQAGIDLGEDDPFAGDINFGLLANETGGKLFYNRNNVDMEIKESEQMGSQYYTLTYQPQRVDPDGQFRRVRVTVRNSDLRVVTRAGYYAEDARASSDSRHQLMIKLAEAVQSTIPFNSLSVGLFSVVRHPDTRTAEFTVELKSKNVTFEPSEAGKAIAQMIVVAASLNQYGNILASSVHTVTLVAHSQDPAQLPEVASRFPFMLRVPLKTRRVRVVIQGKDGGRLGSAEIERTTIDSSPATETPRPELKHRSGSLR